MSTESEDDTIPGGPGNRETLTSQPSAAVGNTSNSAGSDSVERNASTPVVPSLVLADPAEVRNAPSAVVAAAAVPPKRAPTEPGASSLGAHERGAPSAREVGAAPPARGGAAAPSEGRPKTAALDVGTSGERGDNKVGARAAFGRWAVRAVLGVLCAFVIFFLGYLADAAMSGGSAAVRLRLAAMLGVHGTVDGPSSLGSPNATPRAGDGARHTAPTHGTADVPPTSPAQIVGDSPERAAVCAPLASGAWDTIRALAATQLTVDRSGEDFVAGPRTTVGEFIGLGDDLGRPAVLVLGQLACRPCMEELPVIGTAAIEHPAIRIAEVLLEADWDGQGVPYAGGNARRIAQSGLPVAAVPHPDIGRLVRRIPGLSFPAFVFVSSTGSPEKICFGAVTVPTPEGKEFTQWLNRASVRIP